MQVAEDVDPAPDSVHAHADMAGEVGVHELVGRARHQEADERLDLIEVLDLREVANVFAHELVPS